MEPVQISYFFTNSHIAFIFVLILLISYLERSKWEFIMENLRSHLALEKAINFYLVKISKQSFDEQAQAQALSLLTLPDMLEEKSSWINQTHRSWKERGLI